MPEKTGFLYPKLPNPIHYTTLEDTLVSTLRFRYEHRHETKRNHLCGLKFLREAIQELRNYRHNRQNNPEKHAKLDATLLKAERKRFHIIPDTQEDQQNSKLCIDCYKQLTEKRWRTAPAPVASSTENSEQIPLFQ